MLQFNYRYQTNNEIGPITKSSQYNYSFAVSFPMVSLLIFIFWSVPFFYKGKILWLSCLTLHSFTSVILVGYIIKCFFTSFSFVFYVIHFEEIWVQENLSTLTFWHCIPETSDLKTIQDILHHLVQWKFKHFFSFFVYIV